MFNYIQQLDIQITDFITGIIPHIPVFDSIFMFFSQKGNSIFIWLIIIFLLIIFEEKKDKRFILYFIISFVTAGILSNYILKNIFIRPRPPTHLLIYSCPKDFSFPSGHATTAFAAAAILSTFDKKRKWFYYGNATIISLSRIYLYCHFFLDVLVGAALGYLISKFLLILLKKLNPLLRKS